MVSQGRHSCVWRKPRLLFRSGDGIESGVRTSNPPHGTAVASPATAPALCGKAGCHVPLS
jgi:hypothetical protein